MPAGATAGFDIVFMSPGEMSFKKQLQWIINEKHVSKFTITAEVVPIEVKLSTTELKMAFADDSLDIATAEVITMANPGNAAAEFFWASRPPFTITPEQGQIEPFSTQEVMVTWQPSASSKNAAKVALHVPGGLDQELSVIGDLPEARCAFAEKRLELGTLPVGLERDFVVTLNNVGKCAAACLVELPSESAGVRVEPNRCRIPVGGAQRLRVIVKPAVARSFDGLMLLANVRGAKVLRLPITGKSIVPDVGICVEGEAELPRLVAPVGSADDDDVRGREPEILAPADGRLWRARHRLERPAARDAHEPLGDPRDALNCDLGTNADFSLSPRRSTT